MNIKVYAEKKTASKAIDYRFLLGSKYLCAVKKDEYKYDSGKSRFLVSRALEDFNEIIATANLLF